MLLIALNMIFMGTQAQQVLPFSNDESIETLSETSGKFVRVYGITNAEALGFDQLSLAGALSAEIKLSDRITASVAFNFGTQVLKNEKADSVPLSLFYFPDIANTALAGSLDFDLFRWGEEKSSTKKPHHVTVGLESSIQQRNIERDSTIYQFGIFNANVGPKYRWIYAGEDHGAVLTFGVFYNHVRINRNNTDAFNTLFNDYTAPATPDIKPYFHGISCMLSLQIDDVIVFGRTYSDFNQSQDLAFTVGIKACADFFEF
jgi:hypothetical protein